MSSTLPALASYVPALITRRLAADPRPLTEPQLEQMPAVALFADISGFTPIAERLSQRGPQGVEELSRLLNTYFGQLINLINDYGGDIVKFAGDAVLAVWPMALGEEERTALQAVQCALTAQRLLQGFEAGEETLSLRMGVGAGEVVLQHLGGEYGRWHVLVAGDVVAQVAEVERQAEPGQVILSTELWELVREACEVRPTAQGAWRLEAVREPQPPQALVRPALTNEAFAGMQAYVPGAIRTRLAAGQTGWLAELRRVTVIFLHLPTLNHHTALTQAQNIVRTLQRAIYRYEGSMDKISVDEKGVSLIAVLGWPPLAHEDDAVRGVQVARAMQAELRKLGLPGAVGVATGRAFCGTIGNDQRREYTMIGDVVNLAARLMQAADGEVLCENFTQQGAQRAFEFETLPVISVKGRAEPVAVFRPTAEILRARTWVVGEQAPMVGRTAERMTMAERLQLLLGGQGSVILVEGEAGLGKSRLVDDLMEQATALGIESLMGTGDAIKKGTPYSAWQAILGDLLEMNAQSDSGVRPNTLKKLGLEADWLRLLPLLNDVLPLRLDDNEMTAQMTGEVKAENTLNLMLRLLQAASGQNARLVVLEDAQWMDSASWALALRVAQQVKNLLLMITTRPLPEPAPEEYTHLTKLRGVQQIKLTRLSAEDTLTLVSHRLGTSSLPEPVAALIRQRAEGNPFFSEELAYALRDAGHIQIENGECRLTTEVRDLSALNLPDTVQGVITSRIDRLSPPQQLTLKAASVIGRTFPYPTLHHIYPVDADRQQLNTHLEALGRLDLTEQEAPEPELTYAFKHNITRDVAYNLMLFAQRRQLHRAVAEWYESAYPNELPLFYALLAHHWEAAEFQSKAIDYLEKAGEQALENYANDEAIGFFTQALKLQNDPKATRLPSKTDNARKARWELRLGEAYANATQYGEGRKHLEKGLALLGQAPPKGQGQAVVSLLRQIMRQVAHRWFPKSYIGRQAEQKETLLEAARTYERLTEVYFFANEAVPALDAAFRSLNLAEAAGPSPELARAYAPVGTILGFIPLHGLAQAYCQRALEMARPMNNLSARLWVSLVTGVYYAGLGQWATAHGLFDEVVEIAERLGDRRRWDDGMTNLVMLSYFQGEFPRGLEQAELFYASASRRGDVDNQGWALTERAFCALALGRLALAVEAVEELQTLFSENTSIVDEPLRIGVYGSYALTRLRQGQFQLAREAADQVFRLIANATPTSYPALVGYSSVAEVYLTLWELEGNSQMQAAAQNAVKALHKFAGVFPIGQPRAWLWQGRYEWLTGNKSKARQAWQKALEFAQKRLMPYPQALAHAELARFTDSQRPQHLNQARALFTQLGSVDDLAQLPTA